jgi:hemerythrin-like domain-containing protein
MKPTEDLKHDHQAIKAILGILTKISVVAKQTRKPDLDDLDKIIDFLRLFADKFHHGKEETIYFPALVEEGMSNENSPVAVMRFEHEVGRGYIKDMASAIESIKNGDGSAVDKFVESVENYVSLMENHIQKENNILFPMGDKLIPSIKQYSLYKDFIFMEGKLFGQDAHKYYHDLLHQLENKYLT